MSSKLAVDVGDLNNHNPPKNPTMDIKARLCQMAATLSYSTVVLYYRDHEGLGILAQNYHPSTSLIFTF